MHNLYIIDQVNMFSALIILTIAFEHAMQYEVLPILAEGNKLNKKRVD